MHNMKSDIKMANWLTIAAIALVVISVLTGAWWHVGTAFMVIMLAAAHAEEAEKSKANDKDTFCS